MYILPQSREFHERGKRHQENVKKKIDDVRKKGMEDLKKEREMSDSLQEMEKVGDQNQKYISLLTCSF